MHPEIAALADELQAATAGFAALVETYPPERWHQRPGGGGWSASECLAHLNLTSEAYLPSLTAGLEEARRVGGAPPTRHRRDPIGWLLWRTMGPPVRLRVSTAPRFVPEGDAPPSELLERFKGLQAEIAECLREADRLPIHRVKIVSPFDNRVRYNLFSALSLVPRHQLRHLWQAERALADQPGAADATGTEPASSGSGNALIASEEGEMANEKDRETRNEQPRRDATESGKANPGESKERLEPGEGPPAPQGDALLDGSGTRHGVDERDQRPSEGG